MHAIQVVVGGCHSLMDVDGVLHGDPLEASALEGIRWKWDAVSHTAHPDDGETVVALESGGGGGGKGGCADDDDDRDKSTGGNNRKPEGKPGAKAEKRKGGRRKTKARGGSGNSGSDERGVEKASGDGVSVAVWRRYAFSSQLQRMSVVAEVYGGSAGLTDKEGVPEVSGGGQWQRRRGVCHSRRILRPAGPARLPLSDGSISEISEWHFRSNMQHMNIRWTQCSEQKHQRWAVSWTRCQRNVAGSPMQSRAPGFPLFPLFFTPLRVRTRFVALLSWLPRAFRFYDFFFVGYIASWRHMIPIVLSCFGGNV